MRRALLGLALFVLLVPGLAQADLMEGVVAYYSFEGNADDMSSFGNNGIVHGAVLSEDRFGNENYAYSFFPEAYISIDYSPILHPENISISLWAQSDRAGEDFLSVILYNSGQVFVIPNDERVYARVWTGFVGDVPKDIVSTSPLDTEWHHYVMSYDGSTLSFYIDSILQGALYVGEQTTVYPGEETRIGNHLSNRFYWQGKIDDVFIYNRILSDDEVNSLHNAPNPVPEPATMLLFGTGLIGLVGARRKFKR